MAKVLLYVASSLDGYIAREDGDISWLERYQKLDYGYDDFYKGIGTVIMGSRTYEQSVTFTAWPYAGKRTVVATKRRLARVPGRDVDFYAGDLRQLVAEIGKRTDKDIWLMGGSELIASFFDQGLIDEMRLFFIPELINRGIPLFRGTAREASLRLVGTTAYANGVVQLHYGVSY